MQERIHISQKTMDTVVANRLLPEGSPDEQWDILQSTAIRCIDRTFKSPPTTITQQHYEWVLGLIIACLYVFSPQGRIQAVASLLMSQLTELLESGHVLSRAFKTAPTYYYQPVLSNQYANTMIQYYLEKLRPVAVATGGESKFLFISFSGLSFSDDGGGGDFGRYLTRFYHAETDLHIVSTAIRSLVETTAEVSITID